MTDIVGPASSVGSVTVRPSDGRQYGPLDTWFIDCSTPNSDDGTDIPAAWLNQVTGVLRTLARANGLKRDGVTPVVPYDQSDNMPLNGVAQLVQRGSLNFATDSGTPDALLATPATAVAEYLLGMRFLVLKNPSVGANTTAVPTVNFGLGNLTIVKADGSPLGIGDLRKGGAFEVMLDGAGNARLTDLLAPSDVRLNATKQLVFFVRPDGSDSNSGLTDTPTGAFRTPQAAYNYLTRSYNAGLSAVIQMSTTYAAQVLGSAQAVAYPGVIAANVGVSGAISILGDPANQQNYVLTPVQAADGSYVGVASAIQGVTVIGCTVDGSAQTIGANVSAYAGGLITLSNVTLRYTNTSSNWIVINENPNGTVYFSGGTVTVTGGGTVGAVVQVGQGALFGGGSVATTFAVSGMTFAQFFNVNRGNVSLQGITFTGSNNVGSRYKNSGGFIDPQGLAITSIPGSTPGTNPAGGVTVGDPGTPWTAAACAITASSGALSGGSASVRYLLDPQNKRVNFSLAYSVTAAGTGGGSILISNLPFSLQGAGCLIGRETGSTGKALTGTVASANTAAIQFYDNSFPGASGCAGTLSGTLELA